MARVEIPAPGDVVMDALGNVLSGRSVTLKLAGTATDVTHWSALTGGTSATGGLVTYIDGTIRDGSGNRRYVTSGQALDLTVAGVTRQIEPLSASVETRVVRVTAKQYGAYGLGLVDETTQLQAAATAAAGGILEIGPGVYLTTTGNWRIPSNTRVEVHPNALFKPSGDNHAVIFDTPTGTPSTTYALTANGVRDALMVTVSTANAALLYPAGTGNLTSGSRTVTGVSGTFALGYRISGTGIPAGAIIDGVSGTTLTLSSPATADGTAVALQGIANMVAIRDTTTVGGVLVSRESNMIDSINTGTGVITLKHPLGHDYLTASSAYIAPVVPCVNTHWDGGQFDMTGVLQITPDNTGVYSDWALGCSVKNVTGYNFPYKVVTLHAAIDSTIEDCNAYSPTSTAAGQGYTMQLAWSRNCMIKGGWSRNVRHHSDITGGIDCRIEGGFSVGRAASGASAAANLHGLRSRRSVIKGFTAVNCQYGVTAGNGTFDYDTDFSIEDCVAIQCDIGHFISQGCTGWKLRARALKCVERGVAIDSSDGEIDVYVDGVAAGGSTYGAVHFSGTANVTGKAKVRNGVYRSIYSTSTGIVDLEVDVDHPAAATSDAVVVNTAGAASVHKIRGKVVVNDANDTGVSFTAPAGAICHSDADVSGTGLRCVSFTGGSTDQTVGRGKYRGTFSEQLRVDNGVLAYDNCDFASGGTFVRTATSATKVIIGQGNIYPASGTRLSNALAATVVGGGNVQNPNAEQQALATDAIFTLDKFAPRVTKHTGTLTANRAVTLATTDMHKGCWFKITRTGGGAFTLDVGTGPLKSLATNTWGLFMFDGTAWYLDSYGAL